MADDQIKLGDQVSWQWSGSRPGGTVAEVVEQAPLTIETHRGNEVTKQGELGDPAVRIERPGNDVVKNASELDVEKPAETSTKPAAEEPTAPSGEEKQNGGEHEDKKENGDAEIGDKRKADDAAAPEDEASKKQKLDEGAAPNGEAPNGEAPSGEASPKKKGRPTKTGPNGAPRPKKETQKREPKKAATETGEPRRSGRVASKSS